MLTRLAWSFVLANLSMKRHPTTPAAMVTAVTVEYEFQAAGQLWLRYCVEGGKNSLIWPTTNQSKRTDDLWHTSCFELFLRRPGTQPYFEFNFSPSSQWAAYQFDGYRAGMADWDIAAPQIYADNSTTHHALEATVRIPDGDWEASLSAVIHERQDIKSFWALNHPVGPPEFHHSDCFVLKLVSPQTL